VRSSTSFAVDMICSIALRGFRFRLQRAHFLGYKFGVVAFTASE
jgi:hypothetical protein